MKFVRKLCFLSLWASLMLAQSPTDPRPASGTVEAQIKVLREALAEEQQQMAQQRQEIGRQHQEIIQQNQEIQSLQQQIANKQDASTKAGAVSPRIVDAVLTANTPALATSAQDEKPRESPLSFHTGGAEFTPGGFVDLTAFWRNTNPGTGYGTNFFSIPFHNTILGQLSETRLTAENSRITLKVTDKFKGNDVTGYYEMDFHGNDPANLNVTSNSSTMRLRQFWVDVRHNKWEFLGGQAWSWLTPNRVGTSAMPADVFYSQNVDANYQLGLTWTRAPQVRVLFHANDHWGMGVALENPDQFAGQAGQVSFPAAFNNAADGADYFPRNFSLDNSAGAKPNTFVGFGGPGSSNAANRSIQEPTLDWVTTFWKNPQYGALQLMTQVSYLTRSPWAVAAGTPKNARSSMAWANIRYVLP